MWNNTEAVSPVVATLVLVTVAIAGAAGVGMIQGTFSSGVAEDAGSAELASASSTELLIAGSTTVQPVSELLAEAYMDEHQGVKITVQGGGSGAGVSSAGLDIVDIGAASRPVKDKELDKYPDLITHKIGGSAVVVIADKTTYDGVVGNISKDELIMLYNTSAGDTLTMEGGTHTVAATITVVQRADASGTEETFEDFLGLTLDDAVDETGLSTQVSETGNAGVLAKVQGTTNSIGFVDFGFADGADDIVILGIIDGTDTFIASKDNIKAELKSQDNTNYVKDMTRPLNYITSGVPNSMEQGFITFAMSPGATTYFEECGYFAITEFA
jgi:phosphate transport system substrate-binding protein